MKQSSITTRARAQKLNNLNESVNKSRKKSKQSPRGRKSTNAEDDLEATVKQNFRKKLLNAKVTVGKSKKRNTSSRRRDKIEEAENEAAVHKDDSINSKLKKISKDKHADNVPMVRNSDRWIDSGDLSKTPEKVQEKTSMPNIRGLSSGIVTPKSTPIKLSLTPHRSTKTPKKSPISSSSPKTCSASVSRLLKIPRKLSLTPGENLSDNNDFGDNKLRKAGKDTSVANKSSPTSSAVKSKHRVSSVKLKEIVHRFSKSPKIVLRRLSKKSPKLNLFASRKHSLKKFTLAGTPAPDASLGHRSTKSSSAKKNPSLKSLLANKCLKSRLVKLLTASQMRDILAEPIVLVKKLENKLDILTAIVDNNRLNNSINIENSVKISQATAENTPASSTFSLKGSPRRSSATNRSSSNKLSLATEHSPPTQRQNKSSTPLMSSTPREEQTTRINLTSNASILSNDAYPNTRSRYTDQFGVHTTASSPSIMDKSSAAIEDVSKPSLLDISDTNDPSNSAKRQDTTYNVKEAKIELKKVQNNKRDITYELKDPQTPGLRQMIKKRTMTDANLSIKGDTKKFCRVRFANITPDGNGAHGSIGKSIGLQSSVPRNDTTQRNIRIRNLTYKTSSKAQIPKSNKNSLVSQLKLSPKICGVTPKGRLHALNAMTINLGKIQATPKGLESVEKKSERKSSIKKVPNFRRIHEKMFANSESVVDAKKRLETRHLEFATKNIDVKKGVKPLPPSNTTNGTYNRFGFKLRKAEATHVILKKQTVFSRQKQQHETRTVLKSVRTNRRFELQMKARNLSTI
ncbi:PREDICTED: probable serine/threonine-protein kinase nek3 [Dinoponera quadriceps]|uniref:Probable serine/threonine-protein kinase nek3 n=1 Tax=Dinoponera quadriceps TaxID=609295 RepID=A0A6P3XHT2_DINQU|nr:PREDICTED: probable serine/threonine-protein kinase nek3 [Dinoponera quadriceps]